MRTVLDEADFTEDGLSALRPPADGESSELAEIPYFERLLPRGERLTTLIELFHFGLAVDRADAERALAPLPLDRLATVGLLATTPEGIQQIARL